jgi:transposase
MDTKPTHLLNKEALLALFHTQDVDPRVFAREHGIPVSTFDYWLLPKISSNPHLTSSQRAHILSLARSLEQPTLKNLIAAWREANDLSPDARVPTDMTFKNICKREGFLLQTQPRCVAPKAPQKSLPQAPDTFARPSGPKPETPTPTEEELAAQALQLKETRYTEAHRTIPDPHMKQVYPCDMSDEQWAFLAPFIVLPDDEPGRRFDNPRQTLNAIFYVLKTGCPWRYLPKDYPDWNTTYKAFKSLNEDGTVEKIVTALREFDRTKKKRNARPTVGIADTQSVKTTEKGGSAVMTPTSGSKAASA